MKNLKNLASQNKRNKDTQLMEKLYIAKIMGDDDVRDPTPVDVFNPTQREYKFLKNNSALIRTLRKQTKFSTREVQSLILLFHKFAGNQTLG